jgi:hypothetical protein
MGGLSSLALRPRNRASPERGASLTRVSPADRLALIRRSPHAAPAAAILVVFAASRIWAWEAGVRFDATPLGAFWQYVDPQLLRHHLLQSLWYLHSQPPLYNAFLGLCLKLFGAGSAFGPAVHAIYIGIGIAIVFSLYGVALHLGLPRWWAAGVVSLFAVSPAMLLFENWLFYEYVVAALLLLAVVAFIRLERRPTAARSFVLFLVLAMLCYTRASFQILLPLLALVFLVFVFRESRRAIAAGAIVPILLVAALSLKNEALFRTLTTSSWAGMNLAQIDEYGFRGQEEQDLQRRGVITPISAIPAFKPLDAYGRFARPDDSYPGVSVLHDRIKPSSGVPNFNNLEYISISRQYQHNFVQILLHEPHIYLRGVWMGVERAVVPATDYYFFLRNRAKIERWNRIYDGAVLWQPRVHWVDEKPTGTAWGIVVAYLAALLFGLLETVRVLRRRSGSAALAFMWILLAYATVVMTFGEVAENQRVRFPGDPLVVLMVSVLPARYGARVRNAARAWVGRAGGIVPASYSIGAAIAAVVFVVGAAVLAVALPYHDWDSFSFGAWSQSIADGGSVDPYAAGMLGSARPLFYALQGAVWSVTGISFAAGRLLSLAFAVGLIAATWLLVRTVSVRTLDTALGVAVLVAIPALAEEAVAGKSDVPAAAGVALAAALALRDRKHRAYPVLVAVVALLALLTKPTAVLPLGVLACLLFLRARREGWSLRMPVALAAGVGAGVLYEFVMALRFHTGLLAYLRFTTSDGLWAQRARAERWHAMMRVDVLGTGLRLPLTFGLLYAAARVAGLRHRRAAPAALALGLVWAVAGPYAAHVPHGPFDSAESGFTLVGFAAILLACALTAEEDAPRRSALAAGLVLGLPPLAVWAYATPYTDRLAATAWPGLMVLMAGVLACGVRGLRRVGPAPALAPAIVLGVAVWMALGLLDGLHGYEWVELRSLGVSGLGDSQRATNIVLPQVQEALAAAEPALGSRGTMITSDPRFAFFLPGRVVTTVPLHCREVAHAKVFILLTSDESEISAKEAGGLATPEQWQSCRSPKLHQLTDGSDGFAVFSVGA